MSLQISLRNYQQADRQTITTANAQRGRIVHVLLQIDGMSGVFVGAVPVLCGEGGNNNYPLKLAIHLFITSILRDASRAEVRGEPDTVRKQKRSDIDRMADYGIVYRDYV